VWNPVTTAWMFRDAGDHVNALCVLYRATRPSVVQLETLLAMAADGTGAQAWDFDPIVDAPDYAALTRDDASRLLSASYVVRRLLGTHRSKTHRLTCLRTSSMLRRSRQRAIALPMEPNPTNPTASPDTERAVHARFALEARAPVRYQSAGSRSFMMIARVSIAAAVLLVGSVAGRGLKSAGI